MIYAIPRDEFDFLDLYPTYSNNEDYNATDYQLDLADFITQYYRDNGNLADLKECLARYAIDQDYANPDDSGSWNHMLYTFQASAVSKAIEDDEARPDAF